MPDTPTSGPTANPGSSSSSTQAPPWERIFALGSRLFVWGLLTGILYLLQPFFLLVFLTFVFAYILEHGVQGLKHRLRNRATRVVLVSTVFVGGLVAAAILLAPSFQQQAAKIGREYPSYLAKIDSQIDTARDKWKWLAEVIPGDLRTADLIDRALGAFAPEAENGTLSPEADGGLPSGEFGPPLPEPDDVLAGPPPEAGAPSNRAELNAAIDRLLTFASPILGVTSSLLLALMFAFLIVLDLPRLSRATRGLAGTRISFIYEEVAGNLHDFGLIVGRALEAQFLIAICNTILTAIGLWVLGLTDNLVFLSSLVLFFSFIPVVGVFISSSPICLEALSVDGVPLMLGAVVMVTAIHMIEAYVLNPRIFGHHLHMNPVLVLIVLTVCGKLFGIWGLILGLPVMNYVFGHAIRHRPKPSENASAELAA